jgi:hypothetical protein
MREPSRYGRFVIESLPVPSVLQVLGVEALHHAKPLSPSAVPKRERNFAHAAFAKRLNENEGTESFGVHRQLRRLDRIAGLVDGYLSNPWPSLVR